MNLTHVKVEVHESPAFQSVVIPVAVPDLDDVRALAYRLHAANQPFEDVVWGWPVYYDPEVSEDEAAFEIPDGTGGFRTEYRPFWSPASFTIGESGVWFFSLLWEDGRNGEPVEFLDDRNLIAR
ncbi:MAG: hypothetical protein HY328_04420 [Chloroflexi bacterium]|nr:hypothetical protein [Chloroflexota bacterium]